MDLSDYKLICTCCDYEYTLEQSSPRCMECGEPLELKVVEPDAVDFTPFGMQNLISSYIDFYPYFRDTDILSLGEGFTGYLDAGLLGEELGFEPHTLFLKNETQNPTWSFKDRGTVTALNYAKKIGYNKIGTCSAGNMAASCAAYAAAMGMKAYIFVPSTILEEKVLPVAVYGATVVKVIGDYGKLYAACNDLSDKYSIYFANSDVPMRIEGYKSVAYEICQQSNYDPPEWVIVPTSSGGLIRGIEKGFFEMKKAGLIDIIPKLVAAQAGGAGTIVSAWLAGYEKIRHMDVTNTVAPGIANSMPPSGNRVLKLLRENRIARAEAVLEEKILPYQRIMAKSGIFGMPESSVGIAAAKSLLDEGIIKKGERVASIVTGCGLKATSVLSKSTDYEVYEEKLENLDDLISTLE